MVSQKHESVRSLCADYWVNDINPFALLSFLLQSCPTRTHTSRAFWRFFYHDDARRPNSSKHPRCKVQVQVDLLCDYHFAKTKLFLLLSLSLPLPLSLYQPRAVYLSFILSCSVWLRPDLVFGIIHVHQTERLCCGALHISVRMRFSKQKHWKITVMWNSAVCSSSLYFSCVFRISRILSVIFPFLDNLRVRVDVDVL